MYKSPIKKISVSLYDLTTYCNPELLLVINSANIMYTSTNIILLLILAFITTA